VNIARHGETYCNILHCKAAKIFAKKIKSCFIKLNLIDLEIFLCALVINNHLLVLFFQIYLLTDAYLIS